MNKYINILAVLLLCCIATVPVSAQQDPMCTNINQPITRGEVFLNYGSSTDVFSIRNRSSHSLGQPAVGNAVSTVNVLQLGFWARFLVPPLPPIVTATQGDLLDRIQVSWEVNPLGAQATDGFKLYRDNVFLALVDKNTRNYNDFNVIAGRAYNYEVRAINFYGEGPPGKAIGFQTPNGVVTGWVQTLSGRPVPDAFVALTPLQGFSAQFGLNDGAFAQADTGTADNLLPSPAGEWSITFWVKTENGQMNGGILSLHPFPLIIRPIASSTGHEGVRVSQTDNSAVLLTGQFPDSTKNDWHHVTLTMDESSQGRLYIDGALVDIGPLPPVPSAEEIRLGKRTNAPGGWVGCMDELRIYHRRLDELDLGEIKMGTASSQTPDLAYYWKMDEELGTGSFDILRRNKLYFCGAKFKLDRPNVRTMGKTNQDGYYKIESASYGTGTTFLAEPMKDFYMYRALKFVRSEEDYATLPDFSLTAKATLELWVNSAGPDGDQCLLSKRWPGNDFRLLLKQDMLDNNIWFYLGGQEHNFGDLGVGYQHLAFTIDSSGNSRIVTAYKNGVSLGSHTFTSITGNWSDSTETWMLGARPSGMGRADHYGGLIDEIALYDTTLSVASILDHFQNPRDMQAPGLRVYFGLNEGNGNRLNNSGSVLLPFGTSYDTEWTPFASRQMTSPHEFTPNTRQVSLNPSVTSVDQVDFIDRSTVAVSGYVRYKNTDCFAKNVEILINGTSFSPKIFTDSTGKFIVDFDPGTTATLTPVFEDHQFIPAFWEVINVSSPIAGIVFNDVTTRKVSGQVAGGFCKKSVIKAPPGVGTGTFCVVKVRSGDGCLERQIIIDNQEGNYEFKELPPLEILTVSVVEHSDPDVKTAFQVLGGSTVDLTKNDTIIDFIYFAPPEVEIVSGLDPITPTCPTIVLSKGEPVTLELKLKEQYVPIVDNMNNVIDDGVCYLDTANFRLINFVSETLLDTAMSGGLLKYRFVVANPNPSPPYLKTIQIIGISLAGRETSLIKEVVVTGIRNKENTFTTLLPETPTIVLRDPPGDGSYSFIEENTKICKTYTCFYDYEVGGGGGIETHLGGNVNIVSAPLGVGIINNTGPIFDIGAEFQVTYQKISDSTFQTCTTTNQKLSTGDNELIVGGKQGGDVYFGEAINIVFGFADFVSFNDTICEASVKTVLNVEPGDFSTIFAYSEWHLINNVMRYLDSLVLNPDNTPADSARYVESKQRWVDILARNEGLKEKAKLVRNLSFDAGVTFEYSETIDSSFATSTEELTNSEVSASTHFGYEFNKAGVTGMVKFVASTSESVKNEDGTEQGITTGYVLADNDPGDAFTVDIALDSVYKTPVFRTKAGQSSCPWEPETAHREGNSLEFRDGSGPVAVNVPANEPAVFKFYFGNTSATNETWTYAFTAGPESNPHGAKISINGSPMDAPIMYAIPWGTSIPVTVTVERGPEEYDYDSLEVVLYSLCEDVRANALGILPDDDTILYSAHYISAHFIRPCSEVDINVPEQGWVIFPDPLTPGPDDLRRITVSGYDMDVSEFQLIRVQYRRTDGDGAWINITPISDIYNPNWVGFDALPNPKPPTLEPDFTQFFWETTGLSDGPYQIRAVAVCTGDATEIPGYSQTIEGLIDREPPSIVGVPQPSDGVYHVGDEISFTFNQEINCDKINPVDDVLLFDATTNQLIDIDITCYENKIVLDPNFQNEFFENRILRAELHGIEDLRGNVFNGTKFNNGVWEFYVDRNELAWMTDSMGMTKFDDENKTVTANIHNRGGYPVPFTIDSIPDWVHVVPNQGTLAPNEVLPVSFYVDSSLAFGRWSDSIWLRTETGQNPYFMGGSEGLPVGVRVVCRPPFGYVNVGLYENSMSMVVKLNIEGEFSADVEDIVAAFIDDEIRGRANVQYVPQVGGYLAYLTIYGDPSDMLAPINIEIWDASKCQRYGQVVEPFTFQPDNVIGITDNPQVVHTSGLLLREVPFRFGWNWLSFNLAFPDNSLNAALSSLNHPENNLIRAQTTFSTYSNGGWFGTLNNLNNTTMYIHRTDQPDTLRMIGTLIDPATTPIPLVTGWNWIGYIPNYSLPINEALASVPAQYGDIVKGQYSFAQYLNPSFGWVGNLKYMSPPNGYQIRVAQPGVLTYPPENPFTSNPTEERGGPETAFWSVDPTQFEHSSTLIGMLSDEGLNVTEDGMELGVFVGGEVRGAAQAIYIEPLQAYLFFLTYYANTAGELMQFKLYDGAGNTVHNLTETMYFSPNQHQGSIEAPVPFQWQSTGVNTLPEGVSAFEASPNPFSSETQLRFALDKAQEVTLMITDAQGREVVRRPLTAQDGINTTVWNGRSDTGGWLNSGVYMVRLVTDAGSVSRKVVLRRLP